MEYFIVFIALLHIISALMGWMDGRKVDMWISVLRSKNKQIEDLETEIAKLKATNSEVNMMNTAFAKMFADSKH
jgi:hypothetical protein